MPENLDAEDWISGFPIDRGGSLDSMAFMKSKHAILGRTFPLILSILFTLLVALPTSAQAPVEPAAGLSLEMIDIERTQSLGNLQVGDEELTPYRSLLSIELSRQSVLIAARDELGLRTFDAALFEPLGLERTIALVIEVEAYYGGDSHVRLQRGGKDIMDHRIPVKWGAIPRLVTGVELHEVFSREQAPAALRANGLQGEPNRWLDAAPVPLEIEALLNDMSLVPQFRAVRELHQLIREQGESPERLWALTRGYANLAQECRWFIRCQYAAFQARSMLYAQRLRVKAPDHPLGRLSTAYAWVLAGYPKWSAPHLDVLEQAFEDGPGIEQGSLQSWTQLLRACVQHDQQALLQFAKGDGATASVAALWRVMTYEFADMDGLTFGAIRDGLEINPSSTRLLYGGYDAMGVSAGHWLTEAAPEHFRVVTSRQLGRIAHGPKTVLDVLQPVQGRTLLMQDLAELGWALEDLSKAGADPGEFSYAVLGTLIGEANALHALYRAKFMRSQWSVDTSAYLRSVSPALERHPFRPLVLAFQYRQENADEGMARLMRQFSPTYMNGLNISTIIYHLPDGLTFANGWEENHWWRSILDSKSGSGPEMLYGLRWYRGESLRRRGREAHWMSDSDAHHPVRIAARIQYSNLPEKNFEWLQKKYGHHGIVALAVSDRLMQKGDFQSAIEFAHRAAEATPDRRTLEWAARLELLRANERAWIRTLERIQGLPDHGLDHSTIHQIIANTYMNVGRHQEAFAYAIEASESWSYSSLQCAMFASCAIGDYEKAEAFARHIDRRYGEGDWYRMKWCLWSGKGDLKQVLDAYEKHYREKYRDNVSGFSIHWGWALVSAGRFDQAMEVLLKRENDQDITSRELINGVCLAHHLARYDVRDRFLDKLIAYPLLEGKRVRFSLLGDMIRGIFDGEDFDAKALEAWHAAHDEGFEQGFFYLGWLLIYGGEHEIGVPLLKRLAQRPGISTTLCQESRSILRSVGYVNDDLRPIGFEPAHAWPAAEGQRFLN